MLGCISDSNNSSFSGALPQLTTKRQDRGQHSKVRFIIRPRSDIDLGQIKEAQGAAGAGRQLLSPPSHIQDDLTAAG